VFNGTTADTEYVDIGYIGLAESLTAICDFQKTGVGEIYKGGSKADTIDFATGGSAPAPDTPDEPADFVDPASGWSISDIRYASMIDFINGAGDGNGPYKSRGTNSSKPLDFIDYKGTTVDGGKLALAGWAVAEGGIEKYMWTADGGKTWNECFLYNRAGFSDVTGNPGIYDSATQYFSSTGYDVADHPDNIVFQGSEGEPSGICADLKDFAGQTVDVAFALVPNDDPDGLCLLAVIQGVTVE
jgi:hypothetical protein